MGLPGLPDLLWRAFPSQTEMENGHLCRHADQFSGGSVLGMRVKLKVGKRSHVECPVSMCHLGNLCAAHGGAHLVRGLLFETLSWGLLGYFWVRIVILGFYTFSWRRGDEGRWGRQFAKLVFFSSGHLLDFVSRNPLQSCGPCDSFLANRMQASDAYISSSFPKPSAQFLTISLWPYQLLEAVGGAVEGAEARGEWNLEMEGAWVSTGESLLLLSPSPPAGPPTHTALWCDRKQCFPVITHRGLGLFISELGTPPTINVYFQISANCVFKTMQSFTFFYSIWILAGDKLIYMPYYCICASGFLFWVRWKGQTCWSLDYWICLFLKYLWSSFMVFDILFHSLSLMG